MESGVKHLTKFWRVNVSAMSLGLGVAAMSLGLGVGCTQKSLCPQELHESLCPQELHLQTANFGVVGALKVKTKA